MQCYLLNGKNLRCGKDRRALYDAAGIFCTFVCDKCEKAKRRTFNPAIFESGSAYAASGEESDIGIESDY